MPTILRTPEERFADLPGFPCAPHYVENLPGYEQMRMHYVDEGPADAEVVFLCLHGEPSWSYLYRKMIPVFSAAGHRSVAPDFFGFGRSDKPKEDESYTFDFHRNSILRLIEHLDLKNITLVCQDWGGLIGLTLPHEMSERFTRLLVMNTGLGTGENPPGPGFMAWRDYCNANPDMDVGALMGRATPHLTPEEVAAYAAPFPDVTFKAGVRRFPNMVPDNPQADGTEISRKAKDFLKNQWAGQSFLATGMKDPVLGPPAMKALAGIIKNAPEPYAIEEGGHFVQEWGEEIATEALRAFGLS